MSAALVRGKTVKTEINFSSFKILPPETSRKCLKSPLRYPGGKSRAAPLIINNYIKYQETVCSPFVGGGSVELELANRGVKVYCYDTFRPLVIFWQELLKDASALADMVKKYKNMTPSTFYNMQKTLCSLDDRAQIAARFFAINRSSFSGTTLSGGMSPGHPRFVESSIQRLSNFKVNNFSVEYMDFTESIPKHRNDFLYCDPPYLIDQKLYGVKGRRNCTRADLWYLIDQKLYGVKGDKHTSFNHGKLAEILKSRDMWVLSYNDCPEIRKLYNGYRMIEPKWTYGMGNSKKSNELLILSKDSQG